MLTYLETLVIHSTLRTAVLLGCLLSIHLGCGGDSGNRITPPANPTPLPDPESRVEFGGGDDAKESTDRRLNR
jgi:hypothetical protein